MLQEFHEWDKKQNVESPRSPQQQAGQQQQGRWGLLLWTILVIFQENDKSILHAKL